MPTSVETIACRDDNYSYLIRAADGVRCWVVDPSRTPAIIGALDNRESELCGILLTHHHADHVEGIHALITYAASSAGTASPWIAAHILDRGRIDGQTVFVDAKSHGFEATGLEVADQPLEAMHVPGHTRAAIAWKVGDEIFTGDTLFAGGCGRLFEGTPQELFTSLRRLMHVAPESRLWFGHEYTRSNLEFARTHEPENLALRTRLADLAASTTPTTVALEQATNPFVRVANATLFAALRRRKDLA